VQTPNVPPTATYVLLGITVLVFLAQMASQSLLGGDLPAALGLKVNSLIAQGEVWRLITPLFLHASILHIGFNMYALYLFGPGLERHFGHARFLALYFLSGFAGNVMSMIFSPAPSLGASTAIFGLLGAEGVFLYQNRKLFGSFARRALTNIVLIAVINLAIGFSPGIDNWGHLGGLIAGTLFAWLGGPILEVQGILPNLSLSDQREEREVLVAGLVVGVLFAGAAAATIYFRGG
jgi:rhomboid protease GluP